MSRAMSNGLITGETIRELDRQNQARSGVVRGVVESSEGKADETVPDRILAADLELDRAVLKIRPVKPK